jgi:hypothetical protein
MLFARLSSSPEECRKERGLRPTPRLTARVNPTIPRVSPSSPWRGLAPVPGWCEQPFTLSLSWCMWAIPCGRPLWAAHLISTRVVIDQQSLVKPIPPLRVRSITRYLSLKEVSTPLETRKVLAATMSYILYRQTTRRAAVAVCHRSSWAPMGRHRSPAFA